VAEISGIVISVLGGVVWPPPARGRVDDDGRSNRMLLFGAGVAGGIVTAMVAARR